MPFNSTLAQLSSRSRTLATVMTAVPLAQRASAGSLEHDTFAHNNLANLPYAIQAAVVNAKVTMANSPANAGKVVNLLRFLNIVSQQAYCTYKRPSLSDDRRLPLSSAYTAGKTCRPNMLYFLQHEHDKPSFYPFTKVEEPQHIPTAVATHLHPDDVNARKRNNGRVPWHAIECIVYNVENLGRPDTAIAECLLSTRPDLVGVYFLVVNEVAGELRAGWLDAEGVLYSQKYRIEESASLLERFVYSLYIPPSGHCLVDTTVTLDLPCPSQSTTWTITAGLNAYPGATLIFSGKLSTGRTSVFECMAAGKTSIIKDAYVPLGQLRTEASFLKGIHAQGLVDAIVPLKYSEVVQTGEGGDCATASAGERERGVSKKMRLVLGASGVKWSEARSVRDICMAFYDVNEGMWCACNLIAVTLAHRR